MPRSAVWKSVVSSKGSYGAHAAARSGRGAVCRKIFLFPCGRAYFPTKSCSSYPRHLLMLPKQIPSIPAPLRHKKKSKVMRNEEKNKWKQKSSNLPLGIKAKVGLAVKVGRWLWASTCGVSTLFGSFWASRSVMTSCGAFSPALFLSWL